MPPAPKKHGLFCRFVSFFRRRRGIASEDGGRFRPAHPSALGSISDLSLPVDNSTPECHESQPPIRQSSGENNAVESSQCTATLKGGAHRLPRPQPFPVPDSLVAQGSRTIHGGTSFLAGASQFRMGGVRHNDHATQFTIYTGGGGGGGVSNGSRDGMSILPRT